MTTAEIKEQIDFVNKCAKVSEYHEVCEGTLIKIDGEWMVGAESIKKDFPARYRDLLQCAFYGVLKISDKDIYLTNNCIKIYELGDKEKFYTTNGFEAAIEEFLNYIFSQEAL